MILILRVLKEWVLEIKQGMIEELFHNKMDLIFLLNSAYIKENLHMINKLLFQVVN